jgi:hypothetical protein
MFFRLFLVLVAAFNAWSVSRAQELLTLCTEEALRTVVAIGGNYQFGCSTALVTINLTQPLVVERDLTLVSTQEVLLNGQGNTRVFIVKPGVRLTLDRDLIFSGRQTPTNEFTGGVDATAGGGIYNDGGIVTILNGRFEANSIVGVTGRDGLETEEDGESGGDAAGAAIYNNGGQVTVSNTVFTANTVTPGEGGAGGTGGGGFGADGGNGGNGGSSGGAAIYSNGGSLAVFTSIFTNNVALGAAAGSGGAASGFLGFPGLPGEAGDGVGAAIAGANADIVVSACTFVTNSVRGADGLAGNAALLSREGDTGRGGGEGAGAAIYSTGRLSVTNSTFFGNVAVGGIGGDGGAGGSTGFGGDGGDGGNGGTASGGAIETTGAATIINCTFSDNLITPGTGGAGGVGAGLGDDGGAGSRGLALGGAVHAAGSEVAIANSILAHSPMTVSGNIADLGGNLATDRSLLITSASSLRLTNPFLHPLANNGGPTPTMALQTNSLAVNRGLEQYCPPMDQRGTNRVACDIGAFELAGSQLDLPPIPVEVLESFSLSRATNILHLNWTAGYTNLFVQYKTNLNLTNWTTLTNPPTATNGASLALAVNLTNTLRPQAFFRLIGITNLADTNLLFPLAINITNSPI